ncbi:quinone-dependent dihydroorotate dehydrogenase [Roseicyclus sp. F158]|uniref:Dihydroorotate dehydrogenase (quinone) n=1 Tax=Tropicimonas omnivorans TaxID=3075590 RepID=A0ABU3DFS4_9RHOB|nr:quinone-dependent dihydroorotate dehydrogenase [Roseicyclus sp. F158]MDT0682549.1 quinone-dependent dihydroorotate dehydrogenase [Roseicyclus sp. F158]
MSVIERAGLALLHRMDPERAHRIALSALGTGVMPLPGPVSSARLATRLAGLSLPNPVGLAAGFDKNAVALGPLARAGFGWIECGAATPRPQDGNEAPRLWRLSEDRAVINRFGFNNDGAPTIAGRLAARRKGGVPVGLNLGANKDSADRAQDFAAVLTACGPHVDFATVNVSSPNTESLRDLQGSAALAKLLAGVVAARDALEGRPAVFVKIAPDLSDREIEDIAGVAEASGIDGIVATNTTLKRDGLTSADKDRPGGLSGRPLMARSTEVLAKLYRATGGRIPLVGVGGISSAEDAFEKIRAGATAVQLYSALVYDGIGLAARIAEGLDRIAEREGLGSLSDAVGTGV